uniref:Uncharacterized protein n=1 Tax=Arundo donax TaxID=35708 RepID=A0A0A9E0C2_ARUDO
MTCEGLLIWGNIESSISEQTSKEQSLSHLTEDAVFSNFEINNSNQSFNFQYHSVTCMITPP